MKAETVVGPQTAQDSALLPARSLRDGAVAVSEVHGKYYEQSYRGNVFWATMGAGVIFPTTGATAANVLTLTNPAGSGKNLSLISFDMVFTIIPVTPLTGLYGLYVNTNIAAAAVSGTALAPQPALLGSNAGSVAKPLTTSTVPATATLLLPFFQKVTGEIAAVFPIPGMPSVHLDLDGKIILAPGTAITPQQTVNDSTNASVICTFCWEETAL